MSNKPKKSKISTLDDLIRLLDILNITDRKKNKTRQHQFLQAEEEMAYINRVVEKAKTKSNR